jgi:hypothetical protein
MLSLAQLGVSAWNGYCRNKFDLCCFVMVQRSTLRSEIDIKISDIPK